MKISEMIEQLESLREEHGDLPLIMECRDGLSFKDVQYLIYSGIYEEGDIEEIVIDYCYE